MLNVNTKDTKRRQALRSVALVVNFPQILHLVILFISLALKK